MSISILITYTCDECGVEEYISKDIALLSETVTFDLPEGWDLGGNESPKTEHYCDLCVAEHERIVELDEESRKFFETQKEMDKEFWGDSVVDDPLVSMIRNVGSIKIEKAPDEDAESPKWDDYLRGKTRRSAMMADDEWDHNITPFGGN